MLVVMFLQSQINAHVHTLNHVHPGTIVVAAFRRSLSRFEEQQQALKGA
jgi:hypothetical protein